MNPITLYLTSGLLGGFRRPAARLVGGDVQAWFNEHLLKGSGDLLVPVVGLLLVFWFANFLYRKQIFLRL
jgi:hypothetical protein